MSDDQNVRSALVAAGDWAERQAVLPGPGQARRRSRNRSATAVAGAAVLTVAAVVGAVVGVGRLAGDDPVDLAPAAPTTSVEPTPAPTPTPGPPSGVPTVIPGDLELGPEVAPGGEFAGGPVPELQVDVCPGEGIPGVDAAADRRFTLVTGPESAEGRGLLVFPDADGAVAFMGGLRSAAARCAAGMARPEGGTRAIVAEPLAGAWAEGVTLLLVDVPDPGGDPQPIIGSYLLAVRTGSAVALQFRSGEYLFGELPTAPPPDVVEIERRPLDALAPRLCTWTVAGC